MRLTANLPWIHVLHQLETHRKAPTKPGMGNHRRHKSKLADDQVRRMRLDAVTMCNAQLAEKYGVAENTVYHIIRGDTRVKHIF